MIDIWSNPRANSSMIFTVKIGQLSRAVEIKDDLGTDLAVHADEQTSETATTYYT